MKNIEELQKMLVECLKNNDSKKCNEYIDGLNELLSTSKMSEDLLSLLMKTYLLDEGDTVRVYLQSTSNNKLKDFWKIVSSSKEFEENRNAESFKFLCMLMTVTMEKDDKNKTHWAKIIPLLCKYARKNTNLNEEYLDNYAQVMKEFFLDSISSSQKFPALNLLNIKPEEKERFIGLMKSFLNDELIINDVRESTIRENLLGWIGEEGIPSVDDNIVKITSTEPQSQNDDLIKEETIEKAEDLSEKILSEKKDNTSNKEKANDKQKNKQKSLSEKIAGNAQKLGKFVEALEKTAAIVENLEKKNEVQSKEINDLTIALISREKEVEELTQELLRQKESSEAEKFVLLQEIKEKDSKIIKLTEELKSSKQLNTSFDLIKEHSENDMLDDIAMSLKSEYEDYIDSVNDKLDLELGEIYKEKIANIFKILARNGIDMEKN